MVKPEEAARLAHISVRTIFRWIEDGCVHFTETFNHGILICPTSIMAMNFDETMSTGEQVCVAK